MGNFCLRVKNNKNKTDAKKTTKNNSNGETTAKNNNNEKATSKNGLIETSKNIFNVAKDIGSPLLTLAGVAGNQSEIWV